MRKSDLKRLPRLTSILTHLQAHRTVTASDLADRFSVSTRTIYRDIRVLEQAGVPLLTEEGIGYSLLEGYHIPPVMFTESEAYALITAEEFISGNTDGSFVKQFTELTAKVKAVLKNSVKKKAALLQKRIIVRGGEESKCFSNNLSTLQHALANSLLVQLDYGVPAFTTTKRKVEPFAFYATKNNWLLIAFCRLRDDFRVFRLDRMRSVTVLNETFIPQNMTLNDFLRTHYSTSDK